MQSKTFLNSTASITPTTDCKMCFSCGCWPWGVHVADAPTKDEYIFLDKNHSFYPDHRVVSKESCRTFLHLAHTLSLRTTDLSLELSLLPFPQHLLEPSSQPCISETKMPTYYAYGEHNPQVIQDPTTGYWESVDDWPRTYKYLPAYADYQGFHPPGPVYQGHAQGLAPASATYYNYHNVIVLPYSILSCIPVTFCSLG